MTLEFKSIKLKNFMSFESAEVNLDQTGYIMISGTNLNKSDNAASNGSGKSTLISESIIWALTGETLRGTTDVARYGISEKCEVELNFKIDSAEYKIIRTKNPSNLFLYVDGENKSGKGIRDTSKILKDMLPDLTMQLLSSVIIMGQGLPMKFSSNTPSGRKEVLEKLSKSDFMITDLKERIANRLNALKTSLRQLEDNILAIQVQKEAQFNLITENKEIIKALGDINTIESQITVFENSLVELTTYKEALETNYSTLQHEYDDINFSLAEVNKKYDDLKTAYSQQLSTKLSELKLQLESKKFEIQQAQTTALKEVDDKFNSLLLELTKQKSEFTIELKNKKAELTKLKNITDVCPTCGQKLKGVEKPDTTELEQLIEQLDLQLADCNKTLDDTQATYTYEHKKVVNQYSVELDQFTREYSYTEITLQQSLAEFNEQNEIDKNNDTKALLENLTVYNKNIEECKAELLTVNSNINTYTKQLENAKLNYNTFNVKRSSALESIEKAEINITEFETRLEQLVEQKNYFSNKITIVTKMSTYITRDFRGLLLNNIIKYIENKAQEYSLFVFNNNCVNFELSGNNINISYNGRAYENLSGGERVKLDLIIQLAIRDMLCKYLNFSSNILVIDEVFDGLDNYGCDKILELISKSLQDVTAIYIISHHTDLNIPFDSQIAVIKNAEGISYIQGA